MWIKTEDGILINAEKIAYIAKRKVLQQTNSGKIITIGIRIVACFAISDISNDVDIVSYIDDDMEKANTEAKEMMNYIVRNLYDSDIKVMEIDDYK